MNKFRIEDWAPQEKKVDDEPKGKRKKNIVLYDSDLEEQEVDDEQKKEQLKKEEEKKRKEQLDLKMEENNREKALHKYEQNKLMKEIQSMIKNPGSPDGMKDLSKLKKKKSKHFSDSSPQ